ncbi:hypothetical protein [Iodobacter ciconiae]|uniref:Uncharacterized protein n=1 Tax=Iodobacter ciconiae TaxID=2496266 RepID=A0A3S8ZUE2_9NEIS|nr:hypothetical protein [Iodobacter ciconiae]AZN37127.1 hypothetical protein EJO50_11935 [Iodobacter ciconiae]
MKAYKTALIEKKAPLLEPTFLLSNTLGQQGMLRRRLQQAIFLTSGIDTNYSRVKLVVQYYMLCAYFARF